MRNFYMRFLAVLPYVSLVISSPDVPVDTQAIVSTVVFQSTQYSVDTLATYILTTKTLDNLQTITTEVSGTTTIVTTDLGATATTVKSIDSAVTTTVDQVEPITFLSTIGSTTIYSADPTSTASSSTAPASSSTSDSSSTTATSTSLTSSPSSTSTNIPSSAAASAPATSSTSPPAARPSNKAGSGSSPRSGGGLSTGAKAAIGTATVIICAVLLAAAFWLGHRWQTRHAQHEELLDDHLVNPDAAPYGPDTADPTPAAPTAAHDPAAARDLRGMEMRKVSSVVSSSLLLDRNGKRRISHIPELDAEPARPLPGPNRRGGLGYTSSSPGAAGSGRINDISEMPGSTRFGRDGEILK